MKTKSNSDIVKMSKPRLNSFSGMKTRTITSIVLVLIVAIVIFLGAASNAQYDPFHNRTVEQVFTITFYVIMDLLLVLASLEFLHLKKDSNWPLLVKILFVLGPQLIFLWNVNYEIGQHTMAFAANYKHENSKTAAAPEHGTDGLPTNDYPIKHFFDNMKITLIGFIVLLFIFLIIPIFTERFTFGDSLFSIVSAVLLGLIFKSGTFILLNIGWAIFSMLIVIVMFTDIFALLGGVLFGKNKLNERISPKKTIEGSLSGLVFGTVFGFIYFLILSFTLRGDVENSNLFGYTFNLSQWWVFLIAFIVIAITSIAGQIGDLVFSMIKRNNNIKDFSNIFPGHGGLMDRLDSISFAFFSCTFFFVVIYGITHIDRGIPI